MNFLEWADYVATQIEQDWSKPLRFSAYVFGGFLSFFTSNPFGAALGLGSFNYSVGWMLPNETKYAAMVKARTKTVVGAGEGLRYGFDVRKEPLYWGGSMPGQYDYMAYNMKSESYYQYLADLNTYAVSVAEAAEQEELSALRAEYYRIGTETAQFQSQVAKAALESETARADAAESALKTTQEQLAYEQSKAPSGVGKTYGQKPTTPAKAGIGARQSLKAMKGFQ